MLLAMHLGSVLGGSIAGGGMPPLSRFHPLATVGVVGMGIMVPGNLVLLVIGLALSVAFVARRWPIIACIAPGMCFAVVAFRVFNAWIVRE